MIEGKNMQVAPIGYQPQPMNNQGAIAIIPDAAAISLSVPFNTDFDEWIGVGRELFARAHTVNWWIGDWWAFGEHRYGERAYVAVKGIFGSLSYSSLRNIAVVSRAFPPSRRRQALCFSHHQELTSLPADEADKFLDIAQSHGLSVAEIRRMSRNRKIELGLIKPIDQPDVDPVYDDTVMIARAWNRATIEGRRAFLDLAQEAGDGVIDP